MTTAANAAPTSTPAQWAVRWHAVVFFLALIASVPVAHVVWHHLLGHDEPWLRTRSQVAPPEATAANVFDGTWMLAREKQLREDTPVTWWLRTTWNEWRYRCGVPTSPTAPLSRSLPVLAKPKSTILTRSFSASIRFDGLMSRCTTPFFAASARPSATCCA